MSKLDVFVFRAVCILVAFVAASAAPAAAPLIRDGSWTLAILPDTQHYAWAHPRIYNAQTQFLVDNKSLLNLAYVLHEGDVTDHNNSTEWNRASTAHWILDNADIPCSIVPGNHDYGPNGNCSNRQSRMADYFPVSRLEARSTFGGVYPDEPDSPHNSYSLFSAGGTDWLVLALEHAPRDWIVEWADGLLKQYPNRQAMIVTHSYLDNDDTRHEWTGSSGPPSSFKNLPGGVNDGEEMWTQLKDNPNLQFIFCGDTCETGYLASEADHGNVVHQILADYQARPPSGGEGYLRLLEFLPDGETVHVRTYSPYLDRSLTGTDHDFVLTMTQVPEPSSLLLTATGLGFVLVHRHRGVFRRPGVFRRWAPRRFIRTQGWQCNCQPNNLLK